METAAPTGKRRNLTALTTGYMFISLAVSILVAVAANKIWYIIPVFILLVGGYVTFLGTLPRPMVRGTPSTRVYLMAWGVILVAVGAILIVNDVFPNNLALLIAVFLIIVGL
jgi:hypothetical protein